MAFADVENNEMKLVLTALGKEESFKYGLLSQLKFFSVTDDEIVYTLDTEADKIKDLNGSHDSSTAVRSCGRYKIII